MNDWIFFLLFNWEWYFPKRKWDLGKHKSVSIFLPALEEKSKRIQDNKTKGLNNQEFVHIVEVINMWMFCPGTGAK